MIHILDAKGRFANELAANGEQQNRERAMQFMEKELVQNLQFSRARLAAAMQDPRRDINDDCGYPKTSEITSQNYRNLYDRLSIATRVVQVLPNESWQSPPTVVESEDPNETTAFERAWNELGDGLRTESWFQDKESNPIWEHLLRADVLSGVGHFGVLLLGLDDGKDLAEPVEPKEGMKLTFLRAFDESLVDVMSYEMDQISPRFGEPTMYQVRFNDPQNSSQSAAVEQTFTLKVHWSRVVHLADNLGSSEIIGVPRQRPVYNRLLDLRKLYGGSAEMYWRGAFPGLSIQSHPQLGPDVNIDVVAMRDQVEQYQNTLQRYLALAGVDVKSLAPQVVDPSPQIEVQIDAICIQIGVPKRVFMGSERGQLASGQDKVTWNGRLQFRQVMYITPRIVVPFVDKLIFLRVLPTPEGYGVVWPKMDTLNAVEKAQVALNQTEALAKYVQGGVEAMLTPVKFYMHILGLSQDEATAIVEEAAEAEPMLDEEEEEELETQGNPSQKQE